MNAELLEAMEELKNLTALLTGLRRELVDSGWTEPAAEAVVFGIFQKVIMGGVA